MRRWATAALLLLGCRDDSAASPPKVSPPPIPALDPVEAPEAPPISAEVLRGYTRYLADDALEGRSTGTEGGRQSVAWIAAQMRALGLAPQLQPVPLTGTRTRLQTIRTDAGSLDPETLVVSSELAAGDYDQRWPLVRVGYGIVAPEQGHDDYAAKDVTGAVVVVDAGEPAGAFDGQRLTVHGRWTTKLEQARAHGAAGCLIVHDPADASYPWSVVQASFAGERFAATPGPEHPLSVWGWVKSAPQGDTLTAAFEQSSRSFETHNVLAEVGSSQPPIVVVTAHWDHLGTGPDGIFNGAMDNASGVAALLALADAVQRHHARHPLKGTVVFASTAAEEVGLHGSEVLARSLELSDVVAAINLDGMNVGPVTPTVELVAAGRSTLDEVFGAALAHQGRRALPDQAPQDGAAFRSDHFVFARRGVPVLYPQPGYSEAATSALLAFAAERTRRYHTTRDEFDPAWTFAGAVADTLAVYEVVLELAQGEIRPRILQR